MAEVGWTPQALDDLDAVCLFLARDAPKMAGVFAARAFEAVDRLARFPRSGRVVPEVGREDVREVLLGSYRIIYRVLGGQVQVISVHHGARLLDPGHIDQPRT